MADSGYTTEVVEEKLDLVRRYLLQASNGLVAKVKNLEEVQESVVRSSEKLDLYRNCKRELLDKAAEEETLSRFLMVEKWLGKMEIRRKKLGLVQTDVMIKLEKLNDELKLVKWFLGNVECMERKVEGLKKLGCDGSVAMRLQESEAEEAEDCLIKLMLIEGQEVEGSKGKKLEKLVKEIEKTGRVLDVKRKELVAKEKEVDVRKKMLGSKLQGIVAEEKRIKVGEKVFGLRQEGVTSKGNEIGMKILRLMQEQIEHEDNVLNTREKILELRLEENLYKAKELEAREKILNSLKELDSKEEEVEPIRKSTEQLSNEPNSKKRNQSGERMRQKSKKRKGIEVNGTCKTLKRYHPCRVDSVVKETIANDLSNINSARLGNCDSRCDRDGPDSALVHAGLVTDQELGPVSTHNTHSLYADDNQDKLEATSELKNDAELILGHRGNIEDSVVEETIANVLSELGSSHSGNPDSRCDRNGPGSSNPGKASALVYEGLVANNTELGIKSAHLNSGPGSGSAASNTRGPYADGIQVKLEAICGLENDADRVLVPDVTQSHLYSMDISDSLPKSTGNTRSLYADDNQVKLEELGNDAEQICGHDVVEEYPHFLITDFDKDKLKNLSAGQTWASYSQDDLPRSYFRVLKVLNKHTPSELVTLRIAWLQPLPNFLAWKKAWKELKYVNLRVHWKEWIDAGLPVGSGVFKCGKKQTVSLSLDSFSGQLSCRNKNSPYLVHPCEGEAWAIYRNWDIVRWTNNPENHIHCQYDIVEILGRYPNGFRVVYLDKVGGFVSLYQRRSWSQVDTFLIEDQELLRFSHKVPSFKMTGTERQGVPKGSFELDPKDLPANFC